MNSIIKFLAILAIVAVSSTAFAGGNISYGTTFNHGNSAIVGSYQWQTPLPQAQPQYYCKQGVLRTEVATGLPMCIYYREVNEDGEVHVKQMKETPSQGVPGQQMYNNGYNNGQQMYNNGVGNVNYGNTGYNGPSFPWGTPTTCPQISIGNGLARCQ